MTTPSDRSVAPTADPSNEPPAVRLDPHDDDRDSAGEILRTSPPRGRIVGAARNG